MGQFNLVMCVEISFLEAWRVATKYIIDRSDRILDISLLCKGIEKVQISLRFVFSFLWAWRRNQVELNSIAMSGIQNCFQYIVLLFNNASFSAWYRIGDSESFYSLCTQLLQSHFQSSLSNQNNFWSVSVV